MASERMTKFKQTEIAMIPEDWEVIKIEEVLDKIIDYRGKTPKKSNSGIKTLSAKSIKKGRIDYNQTYFISEKTYREWETRGKPEIGDVLLTTEGPLGETAQLDKKDVAIAQRLLVLRGKEKCLDNTYLKYFLMSFIGQHELLSRATGTTVQGIKQSEFRKIQIVKPSFCEQKSIAKILSDIDSKIELNQAMNKTLEAIGQALFKYWFIDFEFPDEDGKPYKSSGAEMVDSELGKIPKDWKVKKLIDICVNITDGSHYSPKENSAGRHFIATVKDMENYDFDLNSCKRISTNDYEKLIRNGCKPEPADILFSKDGTMGVTHLYLGHQNLVLLSSIAIIRPEKKTISNFLYVFLRGNRIQNMIFGGYTSGSALPRIVLKDIKKIPILIPNDSLLEKFNKAFDPIFTKIIKNEEESRILSKIRDSFLPKLISGKIRVNIPEMELKK